MTTLHVTVGEGDQLEERARHRIAAAEAGEDLADTQPVLNVESYADLARLFSETNLELIEAIATADPASMRETAALVNRDFKEVHRNLTELETLGLIELRQEGRSKRPIVPFDNIEVAIDLVDRGDDGIGERPANA